jgi:hypothetical protein
VLTWLAWRGSARVANQAQPREDFTDSSNGGTGSNPTWAALTRTCSATSIITTAQHPGASQRHHGEAQAWPSCRNPNHSGERISSHRRWILNPVGGEVVSVEAVVCLKGRRRKPSEMAGILRRRRRPWSQEGLGVERGVSEGSDWVGLTDPVPVRLG